VQNRETTVKTAYVSESGSGTTFEQMPEMLVIAPGAKAKVGGITYDNTFGTEDMVLDKNSGSGNDTSDSTSIPIQLGTIVVTSSSGINPPSIQFFNSLGEALNYASTLYSGTITIKGTINVDDGQTHTVTIDFEVGNGDVLNVSGNNTNIVFSGSNNTELTINGTLNIGDNGEVSVEGDVDLIINGDVVIEDDGTLTLDNTNSGTNTMGENATLTVENGGKIVIDIEITGKVNGGNASTITIESGGTVSGTDAGNFYDSTGAPVTHSGTPSSGETYEWSDDADGQSSGIDGWAGQ
jgi:hypothetical protein